MMYQGKAFLKRDQHIIDEINRRPTPSRVNLIAAAATCFVFAVMMLAWMVWG